LSNSKVHLFQDYFEINDIISCPFNNIDFLDLYSEFDGIYRHDLTFGYIRESINETTQKGTYTRLNFPNLSNTSRLSEETHFKSSLKYSSLDINICK
jgi:hypothetical protein